MKKPALATFIMKLLLGLALSCWGLHQGAGADELAAADRVGTTFQDCTACPMMVVVPAGSFKMGDDEESRERPSHQVTISHPFAVGKFDITYAEWDACVADGGCGDYHPDDWGQGRTTRPVVFVSWDDAQHYVAWLRHKTGKKYRLLSEAEWEYVARAGTTTKYWWGDELGVGNANCVGCGSEWDGKWTAPSGSFKPNPFGLYDTAGNVTIWIQDAWHKDYQAAPTDGSAWEPGDPRRRVLRKGAWDYHERNQPVAYRNADKPSLRNYRVGFRIACDL